MSNADSSELRLSGSKDQAIEAIMSALPEDAVVRGEDDGIGRFAGERTLVIVSRGEGRLQMFQGTWGSMKRRLENPQFEVVFENGSDGVVARLVREPEQKPTIGSHISNLVSQMVTVAAVVVAYHMIRSIPVDYQLTAIIAAGGGLAWSVIAHFLPKSQDLGLDGLVRKALAPLVEGDPGPSADESD